VSDDMLSIAPIKEVNIDGAGHYLGESQTLELMQSEYIYPAHSNRNTIEEWKEAGSKSIVDRAMEYTKNTLENHHPTHISNEIDDKIRQAFDIRLSKEAIGRP
jgi:trimethylamine--corrinoid protein Co-methyltransferase